MTVYTNLPADNYGRQIHPVLHNTEKDGSGTWYFPTVNANGLAETVTDWVFGKPSLVSANNGKAYWIRGSTSPLDQKGATGWLAELYGGVQTGDDWARLNIPVNEVAVADFDTAKWDYYLTNTETMGVGIVIWVHDPDDFDKRAEITQLGGVAGLEKAAGWNAHEFDSTDAGMFFYGEGTTASGLTAGTQYTWAQFQADVLFSTWTIYRVTFDWGWEASGTFESAYIADVKLNGEIIQLGPEGGRHKKTVQVSKLMIADAKAAGDILSENASTGTDWDFDFGGTGYITKAIVMHDAAITTQLRLFLFSQPPTGETDDNKANTSPVTADAGFFLGSIDFPAMKYLGTGDATTVATPSTSGNLPLAFDAPLIYGILTTVDGVTTVAENLTITLTGDMQD